MSPVAPQGDRTTDPARPWFGQYPLRVRTAFEAPDGSFDALFAASAVEYRDYPFVDFLGKRTTYGEAAALVHRTALGFRRLGVGRGFDFVMV